MLTMGAFTMWVGRVGRVRDGGMKDKWLHEGGMASASRQAVYLGSVLVPNSHAEMPSFDQTMQAHEVSQYREKCIGTIKVVCKNTIRTFMSESSSNVGCCADDVDGRCDRCDNFCFRFYFRSYFRFCGITCWLEVMRPRLADTGTTSFTERM